jgi:hypothetical protein
MDGLNYWTDSLDTSQKSVCAKSNHPIKCFLIIHVLINRGRNFSVPKVRTCFKDRSLLEKPREMHWLLLRKLRVDIEAWPRRWKFSTKIPASGIFSIQSFNKFKVLFFIILSYSHHIHLHCLKIEMSVLYSPLFILLSKSFRYSFNQLNIIGK